MVFLRIAAVALLSLSFVYQTVDAKRGCSAFGHSCYGGHGKRSSDMAPNEGDLNTLVPAAAAAAARRQAGQEEVPTHALYPNGLMAGDDIIPIRDGGAYERDDNEVMKELMKFRLRNIVKHWMENYRRNQLNSEEGLFQEPAL